MVDKTGPNTDPKVAGDVLGEAGVGVPRQQHHARLRPLVHPQTSKALLKLWQISYRNCLYRLHPQMLIRRLGARSFVLKICDKAKTVGIRWKSQTPKQVQCHHQDLLFQYFNSFWQKTDQSRLCRRVKSCTVCVRPIRRLPPLCRPIRARYSTASTNHAAALHFLQPIAALEVASKPRAKSEQNLRRLFQTHKRSL